MRTRIVSDSSCDLFALEGVDFVSVPMSIRTNETEYIDDTNLDTEKMIAEMLAYKGRSYTSCPSPADWESAFDGADQICVFTITKNLSGSYNSANAARDSHLEQHPEKKIHIVDTLSAGPEITLAVCKMQELLLAGVDFDAACEEIDRYVLQTDLLFVLKSLHNFAQNGRVNKMVAAASGPLGIHVVGQASEQGELQIRSKFRGSAKFVSEVLKHMEDMGYKGGRVFIGHVMNEKTACDIRDALLAERPDTWIRMHQLHGLCSYYAEKGGVLVGFER